MKNNRRKAIVIERDNYMVFLENVCGLTFVHADVKKWGRDTFNMARSDLAMLLAMRKSPIFVHADSENKKLIKFALLMGFERVNDILNEDCTQDVFYKKSGGKWDQL